MRNIERSPWQLFSILSLAQSASTKINGTNRETEFVDETQLTVKLMSEDVKEEGELEVKVFERKGLTEEEMSFFIQFHLYPILVNSMVIRMKSWKHPDEERAYFINGNREEFSFQFDQEVISVQVVAPGSEGVDVFQVLVGTEWALVGSDGNRALTALSRMYFPILERT